VFNNCSLDMLITLYIHTVIREENRLRENIWKICHLLWFFIQSTEQLQEKWSTPRFIALIHRAKFSKVHVKAGFLCIMP
jgi:hypothetical protein